MEPMLSRSQALVVLNALPHLGPITANRLLEACGGDPVAVLTTDPAALRSVRGVGPVIAETLVAWRSHVDLAAEERGLRANRATFLAAEDEGYPILLREIHDPPIGLYCRGRYEPAQTSVAIVGSRRTTQYGLATARRLGGELARRGFCVVSGLARGIDTAAHEGALDAGGRTVAVLGTGVDLVYPPENRTLTERIAREGALLSEFRLGRPADRQSFAMRNRIVAGMSAAIVVVESDVDGGSMITARFAAEQGRVVLAVPGRIDQPTSAGCHQLIRDGAVLLTSAEDVVDELSYLRGLRPGPIPDNPARGVVRVDRSEGDDIPDGVDSPSGDSALPAEAAVLELFRGGAILATEEIASALGWSAERAMAVTLRLELSGSLIKRADGRNEEVARGGGIPGSEKNVRTSRHAEEIT
jgi:DNA processing protein